MTQWPARLGVPTEHEDGDGDVVLITCPVLCGRLVRGLAICRGQLGSAKSVMAPTPGRGPDPVLTFEYSIGTGWFARPDGVYQMGKRARSARTVGKTPRLRRGDVRMRRRPDLPAHELGRSPTLPALQRCPDCMVVNVIDERLGIDAPPPGWEIP